MPPKYARSLEFLGENESTATYRLTIRAALTGRHLGSMDIMVPKPVERVELRAHTLSFIRHLEAAADAPDLATLGQTVAEEMNGEDR